ncbi:MAG TPA: hypothetical protein VMF69_23855 [Gemmataceae bacterium]|nr:hypothetical protein [Gemmataceae bacterium]
MIRTAVGLPALLLLLPALRAFDKPEKQTPAQQYQALVEEYKTTQQDFQKALKEAKTPQEQQKISQEKFPADKFAPRFLEFAEKNPKAPDAFAALASVVSIVRTVKSDPKSPRSKAMKILLRDHLQNEKMANVCPALFRPLDEDGRNLLHAMLEKSKHRPAQAQACLALARQAESRLALAQRLKERPAMVKNVEASAGKESVEALVKTSPDKLSKEAEVFYERIVKDFADVPDPRGGTLGELTKDKLEALRHLLVGKPAFDIEGEDINAKKFKLSDYRGKVVLLDFWGNW